MTRFLSCICLLLLGNSLLGQPHAKKTVFIIVDGVPADVINKLDLPHFKEIAKRGGFAAARVGGEKGGYTQTPTISAVGYNSVLTGTWVNKHNVWDNDIADPNYHYPTIFRLLKEQWPAKKTAIFSSWLDNRTKLVGDKFPATGNIPVDFHVDGMELDTIAYPHDRAYGFMHRIDSTVTASAADAIRRDAPDLSWVYLEYTDDMGHRFGDSPAFYDAVAYADEEVGRIWQAIQYRQLQFGEDWLLVVTTDHGRDPETGKGHGGQSDRERAGWILTNAKGLNETFTEGHASITDIMPTIARFMGITIPERVAREVDGVPLTGSLSLTQASAIYQDGKANLQWKSSGKGKVKVWLASANNFHTGSADHYTLLGEWPLEEEKALLDLGKYPSTFYKIVLEGPDNSLNCWIKQ